MSALDPTRALAATLPAAEQSWTPQDVALYHLGVGAGAKGPGSDPHYLLEDRLAPLPTFAALACFPAMIHLDEVPGLEAIDLRRMLHGEHEVELLEPVAPAGRVLTSGAVTAVEKKASGALVSVRQESRREDGSLAWVNRFSTFALGAEDFPGTAPPAESPRLASVPASAPDLVVEVATSPQQAALYRHSGDDNPLHLDPDYARAGGFEKPILQGLCSLGFAVRTVVDGLWDGEATKVSRVATRFTGTVVPGQELRVSAWRSGPGIVFEASTSDGDPVLGRGLLA